jgi:hypothetical protein
MDKVQIIGRSNTAPSSKRLEMNYVKACANYCIEAPKGLRKI